jgi:energy-converting hydrogenase Eha subunit E
MGTPNTDAGPDESDPWKEEPNAIGHSLIHLAAPQLVLVITSIVGAVGCVLTDAPRRCIIVRWFGARAPEILCPLTM